VIAAVAAGLALGLAGCSKPPTSGTVYKRPWQSAGFWYSTDCGMYRTVIKYRTVVTYDSRGRANGSRSDSYSETNCIMWVQHAHPTPPSWSLCLRADDNPKHTGCFGVPESTWNRYETGSHYPDPR
jgi:hypothetical protein